MNFQEPLEQQLRLMETSCRRYDAGNRDEAARLAMQMKVIFHQSVMSTSLLAHLGSQFIDLLSTAAPRPSDIPDGYWPGLVQSVFVPQESMFVGQPKLDAAKRTHRFVAFRYWWEGEPVYQFGHKKVRRRDLILSAADADGGGHADEKLPPAYQWVVDGTGWKMTIQPDNGPRREIILQDAYPASIRQMAYEALESPALRKLAGR